MAPRVPSRGSEQFVVRFPDGMRDRIRDAAEQNGRSMNAEIIARLEGSFEPGIAINDERLFPIFTQWMEWMRQSGWRPPEGSFLKGLMGDEPDPDESS